MTDPIEIIHAYWEGDIGDVEFTELGLDAGMDIEQIGQILQEKRDEESPLTMSMFLNKEDLERAKAERTTSVPLEQSGSGK